jgi:hypothetical protein
MNINKITVELSGKYDLIKLEKFNFKKINYKNLRIIYRFDGVMHRYTFIPVDEKHCKLTIKAKPREELYHAMTLRKISDGEIIKWIDTIQGYSSFRKQLGNVE